MKPFRFALVFLFCAGTAALPRGAELEYAASDRGGTKWAPFVEPSTPFYSSVLDARGFGSKFATNNLTPRGLILNFAEDLHVCFDIDLLRVAAIWRGPGVTPVSMSQGSYENVNWGKKAPEGQELLPHPVGEVWYSNGAYPGIQIADSKSVNFADPRPPGPDPSEVGRGPLADAHFKAIQLSAAGVTLEYEIGGTDIRDRFALDHTEDLVKWFGPHLTRRVVMGPHAETITLLHGLPAWAKDFSPQSAVLPPTTNTTFLDFNQSFYRQPPASATGALASIPPTNRWSEKIVTHVNRTTTNDAYRIEHIALPLENPWHRNVRLADIAFFSDGRAAGITFDGDVWVIEGLRDDLKEVRWRRFASGLHEPLSLAIRRDQIFVYDRNGIWRLLDTDGNGEADRHELFCNNWTQSAETREFASSMKVAPDGSFVIAKPGQTGSTVGRDSGGVFRISADGKTVTRLAHGFRQPFLGINPRTGVITASDQQGHYIPSTPLHFLNGDDRYVGFWPTTLPPKTAPAEAAEPLLWIPHSINASAAGQVWLGENMGPLSHSLMLLGYYRSEIFSILWNGGPNAAVSFTRDLQFPPLSAAVSPIDGSLYVAGFQIWGAEAAQISGLARICYVGGPSALPRDVLPMREGVLIRFGVPVAENSARPENFSVERWNYKRSHEYGSPHFKLDGSKGQDALFASSVYLSKDRQTVFVGIPDMQPVMQMRIGWSLKSDGGRPLEQNAYLTPRQLESFAPEQHGFAALAVDLTPRKSLAPVEATPVTVAEGKRLAELMGCAACHSNDGSTLGKVGPSWKGLAGSRVRLANGATLIADADYLRESIRAPAAKIVKDFDKSDAGMPSYEGVITDAQIEALVLYIQSLAK